MEFLDDVLFRQSHSDKAAVIQGPRSITYDQLRSAAFRLSGLLLERGAGRHDSVVVMLGSSIETIIAFFGILKAGASYLPIDLESPDAFVADVFRRCGTRFVITNSATWSRLQPLVGSELTTVVLIDQYDADAATGPTTSDPRIVSWNQDARSASEVNLLSEAGTRRQRDDVAYVIFTSGSTGTPKGVMITHKSITTLVVEMTKVLSFGADTRNLSILPYHFDGAGVDIFCTLLASGTLIIMGKFLLPGQVLTKLRDDEITHVSLTGTVLKMLVGKYSPISQFQFPALRTMKIGAEKCPSSVIRVLEQHCPHVTYLHMYGPAEVAIVSHINEFDKLPQNVGEFVPFGKPMSTVYCYALNANNEVIRPGEVGELHLGGDQVMKGYINDPDRTAAVLVPDIHIPDRLVYKTGDFVTVDESGVYSFVGRNDDLVKSGGYTVSLIEVEKALLSHELVADAIVLPYEHELASKTVAFVVPRAQLAARDIASFLAARLAAYKLPGDYVFIDESAIPKKTSGKIDRAKLLERYASSIANTVEMKPSNGEQVQ